MTQRDSEDSGHATSANVQGLDAKFVADSSDAGYRTTEQALVADLVEHIAEVRSRALARADLDPRAKAHILSTTEALLKTALKVSVNTPKWRNAIAIVLVVIALAGALLEGGFGKKSPYLADPSRLSDVIAAIQALATYPWHREELGYWQRPDRLGRPRSVDVDKINVTPAMLKYLKEHSGTENPVADIASAQRYLAWRTLFAQHPEFFRLDDNLTRVTLHLRAAKPQNYDPEHLRILTSAEADSLKRQLSRTPLDPAEINTLITTAIQLHGQAVTYQQERRWFVALLFGLAGVLIGVIFKSS